MKVNLILVIISIFSITLFAQNIDIPPKVKNEFSKLYPNTKEVKWSKESKNEFEAEFEENGNLTSVVINSEGEFLQKETRIDIKNLPKEVEIFIVKNYKDFKITEAAKIIDDKGLLTYEAEISKGKEKKDLIFDKKGKIINKKMQKSESEEKENEDKN